MERFYKYKVAWCPTCDQGWVEIIKEVENNETTFYVECSECSQAWATPDDVNKPGGKYLFVNDHEKISSPPHIEEPTAEEIDSLGWEKYIIKN